MNAWEIAAEMERPVAAVRARAERGGVSLRQVRAAGLWNWGSAAKGYSVATGGSTRNGAMRLDIALAKARILKDDVSQAIGGYRGSSLMIAIANSAAV
jgi:hypothetical protein